MAARVVYKRAFNDIFKAIGDPSSFADALFSAKLISPYARDTAKDEHVQTTERAGSLVSAVEPLIELDSKSMGTFVTELRKTGPAGEAVAEKIANGECEWIHEPLHKF